MAIDKINASALLDGGVSTDDIADGAVSGAKIANGAVDTVQMANNSVTTDKITDGNVTSSKLDLENGLDVENAGTALTANRTDSDGVIVDLQKDGSTVGSFGIQSDGFVIDGEDNHVGLKFGSGGITPRYDGSNLDADVSLGNATTRFQDLYLSGGVYLGGIGAANHFDDYEEGFWTPVLKSGSNTISYTTSDSATEFRYIKIGNMVQLNFNLHNETTSGTTGGAFSIQNLPFTSGSKFRTTSTDVFNFSMTFSQNRKQFDLNRNATNMTMRFQNAAGEYTDVSMTGVSASSYMFFNITYFVD